MIYNPLLTEIFHSTNKQVISTQYPVIFAAHVKEISTKYFEFGTFKEFLNLVATKKYLFIFVTHHAKRDELGVI